MPRRPNKPCAQCGTLLWPSKGVPRETPQVCLPCRRARPSYRAHVGRGTSLTHYQCADCGADVHRPPTKGQRPKWCNDCRRTRGRDWISKAARAAIYERGGWVCGICGDDVDRALIGSRSQWRPSLDHIVPVSRGGSDAPENLRLAHFWCNAVLSDGRAYSPEDFRVSS